MSGEGQEQMQNVIADLVGFIAAAIGGFVFRDELSVSLAFTQEFLGKWWDVGAMWYRHSVARGVRNVLALEFLASAALFAIWLWVALASGVITEGGWWLLSFGAAVLLAFLPAFIAVLSFVGVGALDLTWFVRQVQTVNAAGKLADHLRQSVEERRLNSESLRYFNVHHVEAMSAVNHLRARSVMPSANQLQEIAVFDAIIHTWNQQTAKGSEFTDSMHVVVLTHLDLSEHNATRIADVFVQEVTERGGKRAPHVVLPALVAILAPQIAGLFLLLTSVCLVAFNGLNWFTFFFLGMTSFLVYLQGQVALNMLSVTVVKVLVDGGDVFNRILNSIIIRPGLEVLPGITRENYDKVVGGDINLPFKAVGEAVKKNSNRVTMIIHRIFGWVLIVPSIYTFGFVTLSGFYVPYMAAMHRQADLDEKSFLKNLAKAEIGTKYTGYVIRLVQFFLAMFGVMLEPSQLWNGFAGWANSLIGDGALSWTMVGLVIAGAIGATVFMGKHATAQTKVAKYPLLILASVFALLAILPLAGWLGRRGDVGLAVPTVSTSTAHAEATTVRTPSVEAPPPAPDAINRMVGAGSVVTSAQVPANLPDLGMTNSVPPIPARAVAPAAAASAAPESRCDQIARSTRLADELRATLRSRFHCDTTR